MSKRVLIVRTYVRLLFSKFSNSEISGENFENSEFSKFSEFLEFSEFSKFSEFWWSSESSRGVLGSSE